MILVSPFATIEEAEDFKKDLSLFHELPQEIVYLNLRLKDGPLPRVSMEYMETIFRDDTVVSMYEGRNDDDTVIRFLSSLAKVKLAVAMAGLSVSGKGTLAKGLVKLLGYEHFSAGTDRGREFADERGMDIELDDLVQKFKTDPVLGKEFDRFIDEWSKRIFAINTEYILEGRMTGYFAGDDIFKVFTTCTIQTAGERLQHQLIHHPEQRKGQKPYESVAAAVIATGKRNEADRERYLRVGAYEVFPRHRC